MITPGRILASSNRLPKPRRLQSASYNRPTETEIPQASRREACGISLAEDNSLYAHSLNLCEVYYDFLRAADESSAEASIQDLLMLGIIERNVLDSEFCGWTADSRRQGEFRLQI